MDQLAKRAAQIALRLAALPADELRGDAAALDAVEQLAIEILKEVSAARSQRGRPVGETRGMWPVVRPAQPH